MTAMDIKPRTPKMVALINKLAKMESPTYDKSAVDKLGAVVAQEARKRGADIEIIPKKEFGDQIIARWGEGTGGILLMGHIDTVFPIGTLDIMPLRQKDDKLFGPGVLDMKSGLVIILTAIEALQDAGQMPNRPITVFFNTDEEMGSYQSREIIEKLGREASLVLVHEPCEPDGSLITWRKGTGKFNIRVQGRAAHSGGEFEKGLNAIEELAHHIVTIQGLTDQDKGTTINVGAVHGGRAINIVPAYAEADGDIRIMQVKEYLRVEKVITSLTPVLEEIVLKVTCNLNRPPMPFGDIMEGAFDRVHSIAKGIGMDVKAGGVGSASDANFIAPLGIPVLDGLGGCGEGLHSKDEYLNISCLPKRAHLTAALLRDW